ncbi:MAG: hypothetical protein NT150_14755 [Bacteroidetes bacterium]|nr:hypothetical protein [Bacteroidota bacterium]
MSMQELNKIALFVLFAFAIFSCKKEEEKYVYAVNSKTISEAGVQKPSVKTNTEFISITYTDIFGTTVPATQLTKLQTGYLAFGDKGVLEDLLIRNFLNKSGKNLPAAIGSDVKLFISDAYKKIYNRLPNEYEIYYLENLISKNPSITAELFYYALMTSNEYRQF